MTGATSTIGGEGGAEARTLPVLQPRAFSSSTALTKTVDICFIISFPSIVLLNFRFNRVTDAPESGRCSVGGKCALRVVLSISGASVTRLRFSSSTTFSKWQVNRSIAQQPLHLSRWRCKSHTRADTVLNNAESRKLLGPYPTSGVEEVESVETPEARHKTDQQTIRRETT